MVRLLALLFAALLTASAAFAQAVSTASIAGTVRDESGAILPGVTITATQTATSVARTGVTDESGAYTLSNLPIGPYRVEFSLPGFRTFVQTGLVLQVNANPTVNATLALGELSETVQVEAGAALVETRSPGVGQLIDNERVVELPLNGRQATELILLSGMATPSGTLGGARGAGFGAPTTIAVAGGLANGTAYLLDGATHNDPFNSAPMPFPFPEALQEFKVETSALPAQYGHHSGGTVNAVTRSGTNTVSGSVFEFYRDDALNATHPFAAISPDGQRRSDGLNRNQFGGVIGGAVVRDRLFYFTGYQGSLVRVTPTSSFGFVPTPAMLAGDFSAVTSPACNAGRQIALRAPFVNNRVDPSMFSPASLRMAGMLPVPTGECGQVFFDQRSDSDEHVFIGRMDLTLKSNHSMFGRLHLTKMDTPGTYDGSTALSITNAELRNRVYSFVFGDTMVLRPTDVDALRVTINRGDYRKFHTPTFDHSDLGIRATPQVDDLIRMSVSGAFSLYGGPALPGETPTTTYQVADDLTMVRGAHQFGVGANYIYTAFESRSFLAASGNVNFTGQLTGLGLADFLLGRPASFSQGNVTGLSTRSQYIALYAQDSWRLSPNLTFSAGLRWEPYLPMYSVTDQITHFDPERFSAGLRSTVFTNAPAGLMFAGDEGMPGSKVARNQLWNFAPRLGLVWDPEGEGLQALRTSYGRFYDTPHMQGFVTLAQVAPWGNTVTLTSLPGGWDDPWAAYPGGNPVPLQISPDMQFPLSGNYTTFPLDLKATNVDQWNVSYQRQIGADWMASANYLGSHTRDIWTTDQINPTVYIPGASTLANINQRRVLSLRNPAMGQYFSSVQLVTNDGTASYNALLLSVQRRRADGLTVQGNYTFSRCITDLANYEPGVASPSYMIPGNREADRGRCPNSADHIATASLVYVTPAVGNNAVLRAVTGDWQVSGILSARSGSYFTVTTGQDIALTGQGNQRANQVLADPFMPNRSFGQWLNPAAFALPAAGSYGTMAIDAVQGVGRWNVDMGLTRSLRLADQQVQFRVEAFNVFNHVNPANPVSTMNNPNFGKIVNTATEPRIVQLAVKYVF
jgi:hypothetical protein